MLRKTWLLLTVLIFVMTAAIGCGGDNQKASTGTPSQPAAAQSGGVTPKAVSIGTSSMGGIYYVVGSGIASVISKYTGVSANAEATSGSLQNANMMSQNKAEFAIMGVDSIYDISKKQGDFKDKDWPVMMFGKGMVSTFHLVVKSDSGIKKFEDIKGKRVAWQIPGSPMSEKSFRALLEAHGLQESDIKSQVVTPVNDATGRLKEGKVDAVYYLSMPPGQAYVELATTTNVLFVPIAEDKLKKVTEKMPFFSKAPIPAGTYKGQSQEVPSLGALAVFVAHRDLSEDFVYKVAKAMFEHKSELDSVHPGAKYFTDLQSASEIKILPYHPGVIKYYKEKGVWKD